MSIVLDSRNEEETSLRNLLAESPNNARAMARLSFILMERAQTTSDLNEIPMLREEAMSLAKNAIQSKPERPWGYGALAQATDDYEERIKALETSVELSESEEGIQYMTPPAYARALTDLLIEPREEEARQILETKSMGSAAACHPKRRELSEAEGTLYKRIQNALKISWEFAGSNEECIHLLGRLEYRLGLFFRKLEPVQSYRARAKHHLEEAYLRICTDDALSEKALFWHATLNDTSSETDGDDSSSLANFDRCPQSYVVSLYSSFAERYDKLMIGPLMYNTPTRLRCLLDLCVGHTRTKWASRAADLGCGTGLSGLAFRQCFENLEGVDLSLEMIERAKERGCYDNLVVGEMTVILGPDKKFDLIFSCDVFVYVGDLSTIFSSVRESLSPGGYFAFSTELLDEGVAPSRPYVLQTCARFAHKRSYVEETLVSKGMHIDRIQVCPIRKNKGTDVIGMLVVATIDNV